MNAKNLLQTLKIQEQNLDQLITILEEQKNAIVQNNYHALESAISSEQKVLKNVAREEAMRLKEVIEIANHYSLNLPGSSLDNFLTVGKEHLSADINELMKMRITLREKVKHVINVNAQLKNVVDFSRNIIKETLVLVAGSNKHTFVNKRV
jgi:hypothetical protein